MTKKSGINHYLSHITCVVNVLVLMVLINVLALAVLNAQGTKIGSRVVDGTLNYCADAGSSDDYACSLSPAITAYVTGACYTFKANTSNTGAATLNLNSIGSKTLKKVTSGVTTDLSTNDIRVGQLVNVCYDGTNMQMQSVLGNAAVGDGSGSSSVSSVFSRTGNVTAQSGDYSFPQIGGSLAASQIGSGDKQGTGSKLQTFGGGVVSANDCAKFDATGAIVSAGAACGSGGSVQAGAGLEYQDGILQVQKTAVPAKQTFVNTLNFGSIASGACAELPVTITGALVGDRVAPSWPAALENGLIGIMRVTAGNTVTVRLCNVTGSSVDPTSADFGGDLLRSFQ